MILRSACGLAFAMMAVAAHGAECRLDQAHYVEPVSGATMQFHPKTQDDATMTMAVFDVTLPNLEAHYSGDITWNEGNNARPDAAIKELPAWVGNTYTIGKDGSVGLVDDVDMLAPPSILMVNFGRVLHDHLPFIMANPDLQTFDLLTLTGCP